MQTDYHAPLKTMGPKGAWLVVELHVRNRTIFTHADVESITGLRLKSARNLVARLVDHGIATRLKPGLFVLVPFEMGHEREYMGNPYVVAHAARIISHSVSDIIAEIDQVACLALHPLSERSPIAKRRTLSEESSDSIG